MATATTDAIPTSGSAPWAATSTGPQTHRKATDRQTTAALTTYAQSDQRSARDHGRFRRPSRDNTLGTGTGQLYLNVPRWFVVPTHPEGSAGSAPVVAARLVREVARLAVFEVLLAPASAVWRVVVAARLAVVAVAPADLRAVVAVPLAPALAARTVFWHPL